MALPQYDFIQTDYQNPDASIGLKLNIVVVGNTPQEKIESNIRENSARHHDWLEMKEPHDGVAVLIGGGWSINNHIDDIHELKEKGALIIAMNGSSAWARSYGIIPDWQVIVDAKEETSRFVDNDCKQFFASQCDPKTTGNANNLTLVHFGLESIEKFLPEERVKRGGYTLLGCGSSVGIAALSVAFSQGYREMHLFGYDSSYHDDNSHAYIQEMNRFMPTVNVEWGGRTFKTSVAMKGQAEKFPINALSLKNAGCDLHIYGEGLLQTIYNTKYENLSEREKYQLMWNIPSYRNFSPGENAVNTFLEVAKPEGTIIDFGCGTGRAGVKLAETHDVILVDFTDNCRDQEALRLQFVKADLSDSIPVKCDYGLCTDVMEHIPTKDVPFVIENIMNSAGNVFFQISTVDDVMGELIGHSLHLTVKPHKWWKEQFSKYTISWEFEHENASLFFIQTGEENVSR